MNRATFASRAAAVVVALVAGYASYRHIFDVAAAAGEHESVASVLPLAVDGLVLVATLAMMDDKRHHRRPRMSARVALVFGVAATIAANIASANPTVTARLVAAVPAVSFLLAVEVLSRIGKPIPVTDEQPVPAPGNTTTNQAASVTPAKAPAPDPTDPTPVEPAATTAEPAGEPVTPRVVARSLTAAQRVTAAHEGEPTATNERIAVLAGCSVATVKRYRPKRLMTGSPSAGSAAQTPPTESINGAVPQLAGTR